MRRCSSHSSAEIKVAFSCNLLLEGLALVLQNIHYVRATRGASASGLHRQLRGACERLAAERIVDSAWPIRRACHVGLYRVSSTWCGWCRLRWAVTARRADGRLPSGPECSVKDIVREFLLETHENLGQLDLDLVSLEREPGEREILARVFRTLHTIKGTAGFLGLAKLQALSHAGENLLGRLRAGELLFDAEIATALLAVVDAIRKILAAIETTEQEGDGDYSSVVQSLERLTRSSGTAPKLQPASTPTVDFIPRVSQEAVPEPAPVVIGPTRAWIPDPTVTPAPVAAEAREPVEVRAPAVADTSIRVDVGLLDKLMNLVGELVLARNQIVQFANAQEDRTFLGTLQRLNMLTTELQAGVMKTRMQPVGNVWGKFPRLVRDLAAACQKQVRIDMDGQETELDK